MRVWRSSGTYGWKETIEFFIIMIEDMRRYGVTSNVMQVSFTMIINLNFETDKAYVKIGNFWCKLNPICRSLCCIASLFCLWVVCSS
ncbi:hypothetical protein Sjap_020633 [Stephania japonica]|uniref:Uncharacterized protein n=1 Tax=Stephania japonica TaxID=461633 RepID=A0AAP0I0U3_9MAGN